MDRGEPIAFLDTRNHSTAMLFFAGFLAIFAFELSVEMVRTSEKGRQ
jgi:hypothetical protein